MSFGSLSGLLSESLPVLALYDESKSLVARQVAGRARGLQNIWGD